MYRQSTTIRPSARDLSADYDEFAFPELESVIDNAATNNRDRPPSLVGPSAPVPVRLSYPKGIDSPSKPKSRFALQRERDAARKVAISESEGSSLPERFTIDLDNIPDVSGAPASNSKLVGDVVEHSSDVKSMTPTVPSTAPSMPGLYHTGFPSSKHRFTEIPVRFGVPLPAKKITAKDHFKADPSHYSGSKEEDEMGSISQANEQIIAGMTEAEILEEQRSIKEDMGLSEGILRMLEKKRANKQAPTEGDAVEKPKKSGEVEEKDNLRIHGSSTRRTSYEAQNTLETTRRSEKIEEFVKPLDDKDEGSPEYIRQRFFPNEPRNPNLDWMNQTDGDAYNVKESPTTGSTIHFNLDGTVAFKGDHAQPDLLSGSHHVSSSSTFTITALLTLAASTVPSQRSIAFVVLKRIFQGKSNTDLLEGSECRALKIICATKAGIALRETNNGVAVAALELCLLLLLEALPQEPQRHLLEGEEAPETVLSSILATSSLSSLAYQLSLGTLPRESKLDILSLLRVVLDSYASPAIQESNDITQVPNLLNNINKTLIALNWPPTDYESAPSPQAIAFLSAVVRSSRERAIAVVDLKIVNGTMRFLAILPWELLGQEQGLAYELLNETLYLWENLARYGLATSLRSSANALLEPIMDKISAYASDEGGHQSLKNRMIPLVKKWFSLLSIWTVAGIDPHITGHDIVWTQVENWHENALQIYQLAMRTTDLEVQQRLFSASLELLTVWLEGSKVNKPYKGLSERSWVELHFKGDFGKGGKASKLIGKALASISAGSLRHPEEACRMVLSTLRFSDSYAEITNQSLHLLHLDQDFELLFSNTLAYKYDNRTFAHMLAALLPRSSSLMDRLTRTLNVLSLLKVGDEVVARELTDWLLDLVASVKMPLGSFSSLDTTLKLSACSHASILRPFILHFIVGAGHGRVFGPLHPTPKDIRLTSALNGKDMEKKLLGSDWTLVAMDELLRSGSSPVFKKLPPGWDSSELEIVQTSLALTLFCQEGATITARIPASLLIFNITKIFMLEKDNTMGGANASETDLFRETSVKSMIESLLDPYTLKHSPDHLVRYDYRSPKYTLEGVSSSYSSAPFYQLYSDLLGLYDGISLSDQTFAKILLPPLAMAYPSDYRKLFWKDYRQVLRTIHLGIEEVVTDLPDQFSLSRFLYPVETELSLLMAYTGALFSESVLKRDSFLYLIALHHVARTLFPDQLIGHSSSPAIPTETPASNLFQFLSTKHKEGEKVDVFQDLFSYSQPSTEGEKLFVRPMSSCRRPDLIEERQAHFVHMTTVSNK